MIQSPPIRQLPCLVFPCFCFFSFLVLLHPQPYTSINFKSCLKETSSTTSKLRLQGTAISKAGTLTWLFAVQIQPREGIAQHRDPGGGQEHKQRHVGWPSLGKGDRELIDCTLCSGGLKATLSNDNNSEEAKQNAQERLDKLECKLALRSTTADTAVLTCTRSLQEPRLNIFSLRTQCEHL
jgi:hypothetical protein